MICWRRATPISSSCLAARSAFTRSSATPSSSRNSPRSKEALRRGTPMIGICLGAQAIAAVLGSRVYPGREKEIGFGLISLSQEGRASPLAALGETGFRVLHWHGDTFDLPSGTTRLAETAITPNQAFAHGPKVLALQFHVEPRARELERWLIGHTMELGARRHRPPPTPCGHCAAGSGPRTRRRQAVQRLVGRSGLGRSQGDRLTRHSVRRRRGRLAVFGRPDRRAFGRRGRLAGLGRQFRACRSLHVLTLGVPPGGRIGNAALALLRCVNTSSPG